MLKFKESKPLAKRGCAKNGELSAFFEKFLESGYAYVEVTNANDHYKDAYSCTATFKKSLERLGLKHIIPVTRKGKVYLINELLVDED